ncbi:hypothetical protein DT075_21425 [Bacillus licheniformis]|nr:hypothetical protein DT075_21425 [Bacillus licheniformis]
MMINELDKGDDIKDERNWIKANPIVAANEHGLEYLRGELEVAALLTNITRIKHPKFMTSLLLEWEQETSH